MFGGWETPPKIEKSTKLHPKSTKFGEFHIKSTNFFRIPPKLLENVFWWRGRDSSTQKHLSLWISLPTHSRESLESSVHHSCAMNPWTHSLQTLSSICVPFILQDVNYRKIETRKLRYEISRKSEYVPTKIIIFQDFIQEVWEYIYTNFEVAGTCSSRERVHFVDVQELFMNAKNLGMWHFRPYLKYLAIV